MSTITAPPRSTAQRLEALTRANHVRVDRARLKHAIRRGDRALALDLIREPTPAVATMRVEDLLRALPGVGRVRARQMFKHAGLSQSKTLGGLTDRQREALLKELDRRP